MGRDTARHSFEIAAKTASTPAPRAWIPGLALFGIALILLLATRIASAEPLTADPTVVVSAALLAVHVDTPQAQPTTVRVDDLLIVPHATLYLTDAELADESIAAAVELGTNPDLIRRSNFRKKSMDLFRTERQVEIARRDMLVRLRVRAKMRRAMSLEVRF